MKKVAILLILSTFSLFGMEPQGGENEEPMESQDAQSPQSPQSVNSPARLLRSPINRSPRAGVRPFGQRVLGDTIPDQSPSPSSMRSPDGKRVLSSPDASPARARRRLFGEETNDNRPIPRCVIIQTQPKRIPYEDLSSSGSDSDSDSDSESQSSQEYISPAQQALNREQDIALRKQKIEEMSKRAEVRRVLLHLSDMGEPYPVAGPYSGQAQRLSSLATFYWYVPGRGRHYDEFTYKNRRDQQRTFAFTLDEEGRQIDPPVIQGPRYAPDFSE